METNGKGRARTALAWLGALGLSVPMASLALAAVLYIFSRGGHVPARYIMWGVGTGLIAIAVILALRRRLVTPMKGSLAATGALVWLVGVGCEVYHRNASRPGIGNPHEGRAVRVLVAELTSGTVSPLYRTHRVWIRPYRAKLIHRDLDAMCPDGRPDVFLQHDVEPATSDAAAALGRVDARRLVVGIHGFNVKADEAAARLATALDDAGVRGEAAPTVLAVLWPSEAYPQKYQRDVAKTRAPEIVPGLVTVLRALPIEAQREVTIVAHSAGNVLLARALAQPGALTGTSIRMAISLNSDLPLDQLPMYIAHLGAVSDQVHLFVDSTDQSLRISSVLNGVLTSEPRAGQLSPAAAEATVRALARTGRLASSVRVVLHTMSGATVSSDDPPDTGSSGAARAWPRAWASWSPGVGSASTSPRSFR